MKRLLTIFLLMMTLSATVHAQDPSGPQEPTTKTGYGYGDRRPEVFVSGFGLFSKQATEAGGASFGYGFQLNSSSVLEGRYGFSRNSQKYTMGSTVSSIPTYLSEISGSYIYRFAKSHSIQPFLEGGGGVVLFRPGNYGGGTTASDAGTPANNVGYGVGGYTYLQKPNSASRSYVAAADPIYGGSAAGLSRQARGMFLYGAGADVPAFSRLYFRMELRSLGYKTPDFGTAALRTNGFSFAYEPSVGVAYRF